MRILLFAGFVIVICISGSLTCNKGDLTFCDNLNGCVQNNVTNATCALNATLLSCGYKLNKTAGKCECNQNQTNYCPTRHGCTDSVSCNLTAALSVCATGYQLVSGQCNSTNGTTTTAAATTTAHAAATTAGATIAATTTTHAAATTAGAAAATTGVPSVTTPTPAAVTTSSTSDLVCPNSTSTTTCVNQCTQDSQCTTAGQKCCGAVGCQVCVTAERRCTAPQVFCPLKNNCTTAALCAAAALTTRPPDPSPTTGQPIVTTVKPRRFLNSPVMLNSGVASDFKLGSILSVPLTAQLSFVTTESTGVSKWEASTDGTTWVALASYTGAVTNNTRVRFTPDATAHGVAKLTINEGSQITTILQPIFPPLTPKTVTLVSASLNFSEGSSDNASPMTALMSLSEVVPTAFAIAAEDLVRLPADFIKAYREKLDLLSRSVVSIRLMSQTLNVGIVRMQRYNMSAISTAQWIDIGLLGGSMTSFVGMEEAIRVVTDPDASGVITLAFKAIIPNQGPPPAATSPTPAPTQLAANEKQLTITVNLRE